MYRLGCIAFTAALLLSPDVPQASNLQQQTQAPRQIPPDQSVPVLPDFAPPAAQDPDVTPQPPPPPPKNAPPLKEQSRLDIIRYVSGEFARVAAPLPGGKRGFHLMAGEPLDLVGLKREVIISGAALNTGDNAQITKIEFREREIVVDINGGGSGGGTPLRNRIQIQASGVPLSTSTSGGNNGPVIQQKTGVTLFLDFGRPLPDVSSDDVKKYLSVVLDFSKQRSAAVQWTASLPPKVQEAITDKRAEVGMDHDEVLAALGRPDRKVREQDADGNDTEDWIYGKPPATTIFVRFIGEKVTKVDQYP